MMYDSFLEINDSLITETSVVIIGTKQMDTEAGLYHKVGNSNRIRLVLHSSSNSNTSETGLP